MPGVNLIYSHKLIADFELQLAEYYQEVSAMLPDTVIEKLLLNEHTALLLSTNPGYQIQKISMHDWQIFLECRESNPSCITSLITEFSEIQPSEAEFGRLWSKHFGNFPHSFFWLAYNNESKTLLWANDALARLPVYSYTDEHIRFVGRDIALATKLAAKLTPNPLYCALYLSFCYVPGRGTVWDELDTIPAASMACLDTATSAYSCSSQPLLRFVEPDRRGTYADRLVEAAECFLSATRPYKSYPNCVLALSGGMDSRLVAAAFAHHNIPFGSITYMDSAQTATDDMAIAKQLASNLNSEHIVLTLNRETPALYEKLRFIKQGVNYLGMAFFLEFMDAVAQSYPQLITFVTGDGGDKVLPNLLPDKHITNAESFLQYLYTKQTYISPRIAAALFGISPTLMDEYLIRLVDMYPTESYDVRYKHFLLAERSARWLFEGEDRNRYSFASETPFFDYNFYKTVMQIPDNWKNDNLFYIRMMKHISPTIGDIRLANSRVVPNKVLNPIYRTALAAYRFAITKRQLQPPLPTSTPSFPMREWLMQETANILNADNCCSVKMDRSILIADYLAQLNRSQLNIVYTVLTSICR